MRRGWNGRKLVEVCQFLNRGISPVYLKDGGIAVLNQKCVRGHAIDTTLARRHNLAIKRVQQDRLIRKGDVLINSTGTGTLGRVAQVRVEPSEPTTVDSHVTIVRPVDGLFVPEFFGYALVAIEEQIKASGEGCGGQTELARSKLANDFEIQFPDELEEQQRIVTILDEAFAGIATVKANAEKNLQNTRELFESARESTLSGNREGWAEAPLEDLCEIKHGFAFQGEYFAAAGDYILLTPGNFYESGGYRNRGVKQKHYVGEVPQGFVLSRGDLLVAMTEQAAGLLGSPALIPESGIFLHNQRLGLVSGKTGAPWRNEFFFHVFNTKRVRQEIHESASGVKVRHTSPKKIGKVVVPFPTSVHEQERIAVRLEELARDAFDLQLIYRNKLSALDELKQSLLAMAFAGELT